MKKVALGAVGVVLVSLACNAGTVAIDVRPADASNFVDTTSTNKTIDVALLTTSIVEGDATDFDATLVDPASVLLGVGLAQPDANYFPAAVKDVDGDGDDDLNLTFAIPQTGIRCEDSTVNLAGELFSGGLVSGSDLVTTPDCPNCHDEPANYREPDGEAFFVAEDSILTVTDAAPDGFTALEDDAANGLLSVAPDGSFSYTPEPDFFGLDSFSYRDDSGTLSSIRLSIESVNDLPIATTDTFSVVRGAEITRSAPGVLANDSDIESSTLTATLVSGATQGTLEFSDDGSFSYTPNADFSGHDSFSYHVSDGTADSETATVNITLPNILLILVDDMGQGDAPIYNPDSAIPMPNLTALANAGIRFDNAHASAASCSPTRYSLLTGNYPYRGQRPGGVWKSFDPDTMIIPGQQTLGHTLQAANYRTGFVGKLHNGGAFWNEAGTAYTRTFNELDFTRSFDRGPTQFGFDYSFLLPGGVGTGPYAYFENDRLVRYDAGTSQFLPFATSDDARLHLVSVTNNQPFNGGLISKGGKAMDNYDSRQVGPTLTNRAVAFIDQHLGTNEQQGTNQPFFLYMATPEPHTPWTPPPVFNSANPTDVEIGSPGTPIENATVISERTDTVYETDVILGTLVAKLDDEGLLNNTLIIFTSDNGPNNQLTQSGYNGIGQRIETGPGGDQHINAQGAVDGVPLRGHKLQIYEGGHKAPLVMRWGDGTEEGSVIQPGSANTQMIGLQDMMATLADLTAVNLPADQANDSVSYRPILLNPGSLQMREHMIIQGNSSGDTYGLAGRALYERDQSSNLWKLIVDFDLEDPQLGIQFAALYNLTLDPGETNNLIDDPTAEPQLTTMSADYLSLISLDRTAD